MATVEDIDGVIERCQQAMREFGRGNPKPMQALCSHGEDVIINTAIDRSFWAHAQARRARSRRPSARGLRRRSGACCYGT